MSLTRVWMQTLADGLIRADHIIGINVHPSPATGRHPQHWLLDVVLPTQFGGGTGPDWTLDVLHRTLIQTTGRPNGAPVALARLLAQLDAISADGVITTATSTGDRAHASTIDRNDSSHVRFQFTPFAPLPTGQHTDAEYL